jgi:hypothetical protein
LSKAEALAQLVERPDLAANISAAARLWGVSRATVRAWLAEYAAMATPPAATDAAMAAPPSPAEAVKAVLSDLCDASENISPQHLVDSADDVEILGLHGDAQLAAGWLVAVEREAAAAIKRRAR